MLLLPLLLAGLVVLWLVLLPVLLQRYRLGRPRQRATGWWWARTHGCCWAPQCCCWRARGWDSGGWPMPCRSAGGLAVGILLGVLGTRLATLEFTPGGVFHTPNRWLALLLTLVIAMRMGLGVWQARLHVDAGHALGGLLEQPRQPVRAGWTADGALPRLCVGPVSRIAQRAMTALPGDA